MYSIQQHSVQQVRRFLISIIARGLFASSSRFAAKGLVILIKSSSVAIGWAHSNGISPPSPNKPKTPLSCYLHAMSFNDVKRTNRLLQLLIFFGNSNMYWGVTNVIMGIRGPAVVKANVTGQLIINVLQNMTI